MMVTMPNAVATRASIAAQRGGWDIVLFMTYALLTRETLSISPLVLRNAARKIFCRSC
jgi:hypothetical protein